MKDKIVLAEKFALLSEPKGTVNTGDAGVELTAEPAEL